MGTFARAGSKKVKFGVILRVMTKLLDKAIQQARKLPPEKQDAIGVRLLKELEADQKWDVRLDASADTLDKLAEEALAEFRADETEPFDPEQMK